MTEPIRRPAAALRDAALALLVFGVAAAVRLPYLHQIPRYTDELTLWRLAAQLRAGGPWPLVFSDTGYNGAWPIYLLALLRAFTGSLEGPRILALLVGSGIVMGSYLVARELCGRGPGLVAAALMAVGLTPVLVYSHIIHMVPAAALLQTLGWWAAARAARLRSGPGLVVAGFLVGGALQTHPLCFAFLPGLLLWLWRSPSSRRIVTAPWWAAAGGGLILGLAPLLIHHLPTPGAAPEARLSGVAENLGRHLREVPPYAEGLRGFAAALIDTLGNVAHGPDRVGWGDPFGLLLLAVALVGLVRGARAGNTLPVALFASALLVMPALVTRYQNTLPGRYVGLTLPLLCLGIALSFTGRAESRPGVEAHPAEDRTARRRARTWQLGRLAGLLLVLAMLGTRLQGYFAAEAAAGRTNADLRRVVALVERAGLPVVLDGSIKRSDGRGSGPSALLLGLLEWRGVEVRKESDPAELKAYLLAIDWPVLVIAADQTFQSQFGHLPAARGATPVDPASPTPRHLTLLAPGARIAPTAVEPGWSVARFGAGGP